MFAILDSLPLGILIKAEFSRRRRVRIARLDPNRQREAAQRYARGLEGIHHGGREPTGTPLGDGYLRHLAQLDRLVSPELSLAIEDGNGLRQLAGLKALK